MQLNGTTLVDRHNRPSINGKVAVRSIFMNDGSYFDPYDISACTIFSKLANVTPSGVVDSTTGILTDAASGIALMNFEISGDPAASDPHDGLLTKVTSERLLNTTWFPGYTPHTAASGIHRVGVGDYIAVLDGSLALSGVYNLNKAYQTGETIANQASSVQDYIDVWTVKLYEQSEYQLFINALKLHNDAFVVVTEPLLLTTSNRLVNKHIVYGSIIDMKVTTDITVGNRTLDESTKNILKDYPITSPQIKIEKVNEDNPSAPARTAITVGGFISTNVRTTSENTIIYSFDTTAIPAILTDAGVGGPTGTYILTAQYSFLNQTFITDPYYFTIS